MAKIREEIVGKRFLSVSNSCKLKLSKISQWDWRAGVIRACTHADIKHPELQILVEYEDVSWERREWIHVHKEQAFQVLLVEHTLVLAPRNCWPKLRGPSGLCPALIFDTLVDDVGLTETKERPVEYLVDRVLEFHDYDTVKNYQEEECSPLNDDCREAVRKWVAEQDGQRILCTTPSVLVGFRVQVYRSEGTTQWYTAVIVGYNENTRELTVTDDTVLEEHSENPSLVHIRLLGEGVVESILRGENVGITPRRSRSGVNNTHASGIRHHRRETVASLRGRKSSCPTTKVPTPLVSPLLSQSPPSPAQSTSPSSPRLPLTINPLKSNNSSADNSGEEPTQIQDLHSFRTSSASKFPLPTVLLEVNKEEKSSNYCNVPSPSQEENLPLKLICNPNPSNSPSSPTNPDKPTNPRKETSKPSLSESESSATKISSPLKTISESSLKANSESSLKTNLESSLKANSESSLNTNLETSLKTNSERSLKTNSERSLKTNLESPLKTNSESSLKANLERSLKTSSERSLTHPATDAKDQSPSIPEVKDNQSPSEKLEKESYSLAKNTCLPNNSLKKVLIKVKNNLQLIDPLSFSEKDREETVSKDSNGLTSNSIVTKTNLEESKSKTSDFLVIEKYSVLRPSSKVTSVNDLCKNDSNSEKNQKVQNSNNPNKVVDICDLTSSTNLNLKLISEKCSLNNFKKSSEVCELSNPNSNRNSLNSNPSRGLESNDLKKTVLTTSSELKSVDAIPHLDNKSEESKQSDKNINQKQDIVDCKSLDNQCNKPLLDIPLQTRSNEELNNNNNNSKISEEPSKTSSEKELKNSKGVISKDCVELEKNCTSPVKKEAVELENSNDHISNNKHSGGLNLSVNKVLTENSNNNNSNSSSDIKPFEVPPLSNGRVRRPLNSLVYHTNTPTSVPSDNKSNVPDFLKIRQNNNNNNTYRKVILLSSEGLKVEGNNSDELLDKNNSAIPFPSIGLLKSTSDVSPLAVTLPSNVESNVDVASRLLNTDCTLSLSRVGDSSCNHRKSPLPSDDLSIVTVTPTTVTTSEDSAASNKVGVSSYSPPGSRVNSLHSSYNSGSVGGELAHSLAAAGAVSGRAVTITATSGPAPQGNSRVASPPSVSITAVVRSPNTAYNPHPPQPTHHNPSELTIHHHHHDGGSVQLHHPHPPQTHLGPLSTATRMDQGDGSSDSGVSVTERSVSRSSVLSDDRSSSAEVKPNTPTPTPVSVAAPLKSSLPALVVDRKESVKVWRNPAVLSQSELSVRHIHSLQHTAMSQHFPGVHPHIAPPSSAQAVTHPGSLPTTAHGLLPPPRSSLPHAIPPLHYPGHPGPPPLHLTPGLQPTLSAAAALYPQLQQDVWKQLQGHVGPLASNAYAASLLPSRHQEELSYLEHQARELEKQQMVDRSQRERREAEAREKQAKEKMDRERERRKERDRRERDERERSRRAEWSSEADLQLVNKHFEDSFRYASQKLGRENLRQMPPSENHPASVFYSQGLTSQQTAPTHLTHPPSLLISQQPTSQSTSQSQQQTQNKNFQPHSQGSPWGQNIGNLSLKVDGRDHRQQPPPRHQPTSQPSNESIRKVKEPEQFVKESIYNAFRSTDDPNNDPQIKSHNPPPAHSKHPSDKSSPNLPGYPVPFALKEHKPHVLDRSSYPIPPSHEKASVIVQPDLKYDKVAQHSVSPKQRPPERSSPYSAQPPAQGPNHYKPYEPATPNRASSNIHHSSSLSPSPHNVELTKARQPLSSPHAIQPSAASNERYYSSGTKPPVSSPYQINLAPGGILPNHLHNINTIPVKSKVSSPPLQMYGKPGITSGAPVCKIDTRPNPQPLPLTSKAPTLNGPPPAHLGSRNHDARPPPTPHEQRVSHNRSPFDTRHYPGSGVSHPKTVTTSVVSTHPTPRIPPTSSPHVMSGHHSPHPPTQTQPLDLGTRDGSSSSPTARRRSLTPTPQETKRPRLENVSPSPMLSRVSEPSPLYPTAATTITTVENTVAFAKLQRVSSPVVSNAQSCVVSSNITKSSSVITNSPSNSTFSSNSNPPETANPSVPVTVSRPSSQPPPSASPVALTTTANRMETSSPPNSKQLEPEKCSSPGPAGGPGHGYVHKLKKAWLQRHTSGAEPSPSNHSNGSNNNSSGSNSSSSTGSTSASSCSISPTKSSSTITPPKPDSKQPIRKIKPSPGLPNGHGQEGKEMDSTSTDSDDSNSPKIKRMKTKRNLKRMKKGSESNSDSDKESDGSEGSIKKSGNLPMKQDIEPRRRRGRKPKIKQEKEDLLKVKRSKDDTPNDPLQKPPVSQLKKTGESFLQDRSCYEVAPKLPKCRECRWTAQQRNKKMPNIFCRFYAFRRLRYTKNGQLAVAGFSDPVKDAYGEDLRLWVPDLAAPASDLDCEMSKFLLTHVGDQFCDLVQQENEAMALHMGEDPVVAWKRVVQGVREMCDVCETTLFNIHWACSKCGFVVCIDCYKGRKEGTVKVWDVDEGAKERDKYSWLLCASRVPHELDKLMLTQIIAGNALADLGSKIHEWRYKWGVAMYCGCPEASKYKEKEQEDKKLNGINKDLIKNIKKESKSDMVNGTVKLEKGERINGKDDDMSNSPLNFFADVALSNDKRESESSNSDSDSDSDGKEGQPSTLRELLTVRSSSKSSVIGKDDSSTSKSKEPSKKKAKLDTLDDVISCVIERGADKDNKKDPMKVELKHFIRKYNYNRKGKEPLPIRIMTKTESRLLYPNVPHSWLCDGKLLRLHDPLHKDNVTIFQDQWKRGQPVIVSGTGQNLDSDLWKPQSFAKDFGEAKNNLINCLTDNIVPNQPMKKFWEGFEHCGKRLKDEKGQPMVLKLKDWPPTDDFAEMLPRRFNDLMRILPMGEYTRRNGSLNLAGRLPDCFVRPDLGPKMYIAYGSVSYPSKASTNLHLDISDAVNVMCYVGVPKDVEYEENMRDTLKAIDDAGCDILTRQRVREKEEIPGALWHIYHARDSDKIRDLLNKVAIERGKKLEPFHDPIHDQSWYLDGPLRERLYKEYAVEGYAIVQCMGDAVFIPAGAPHQVRNLQNCVKVAEDFVSPENISHCFHLTQEFRHLSDTHTNHEDKLQIKNIIYHAMKDAISSLMASEQRMESEIKKEGNS